MVRAKRQQCLKKLLGIHWLWKHRHHHWHHCWLQSQWSGEGGSQIMFQYTTILPCNFITTGSKTPIIFQLGQPNYTLTHSRVTKYNER